MSVGQSVDAHTVVVATAGARLVMSGAASVPVRIANCSGFFGDRLAAAREMVEGGPIDVLTGDWLAELTMLILARQRMKHGAGSGYARTFLTQMEQVLGTCLDRGIKVVSQRRRPRPGRRCGAALREKADELGLGHVRIAYVEGDDLMPRLDELRGRGRDVHQPRHRRDARSFGMPPLTANAYLGGRGITAALAAGADVVITGRVTDAALVVGPAAWWHGWSYDDAANLDRLAGAVVAGHVIECGAQATGGNYAFFREVPGLEHVGFPWAEVADDGSSVIGKHDGTGGLVSVGTVTAQLLYEIGGPAYANPDVTARFDTIELAAGRRPTACAISGVRGLRRARARLKVAMNTLGGFRNTASLVLTGLDIEAKADLALRTVAGVTLAAGTLGVAAGERRREHGSGCASCTSTCCAATGEDPAYDRRRAGRAAAHREGRRPEGGRQGVHRADRRERAGHVPGHVPDRAAGRGHAVRRLLADHGRRRAASSRPSRSTASRRRRRRPAPVGRSVGDGGRT